MDKTLKYLNKKFSLAFDQNTTLPIEIPNCGRNNLSDFIRELNFKTGAEIGVMVGEFSEILMRDNPQFKLYCVDPWRAQGDYLDETQQSTFDKYYSEARTRLINKNCQIIRKSSMDALADFPNESLDFVYIDANHRLQYVIDDIAEWSKKVKPGGIISGHDYKLHKPSQHMHIYQAVNAYVDAYEIKPWFVLGRYNKKPGTIRDISRSWMWIKQ